MSVDCKPPLAVLGHVELSHFRPVCSPNGYMNIQSVNIYMCMIMYTHYCAYKIPMDAVHETYEYEHR